MATLKDLGLSEYEASAYRALLDVGPATAKELSEASDVPMGRIYDVLGSIEAKHLVRSQTASRPKKYAAVEPESALNRLLEDRKRELAERADQYESVVSELERELGSPASPDSRFWTAAVGPEETLDLYLERLDAAEERIVMITNTPSAGFDVGEVSETVIGHLRDALDRGVEVSVLLTRDLFESLPPEAAERYASELAGDENFEARASDAVNGSLTVIDGTEVCVETTNPLRADETFALIDLKDAEFAREVCGEFDDTWANARPIEADALTT